MRQLHVVSVSPDGKSVLLSGTSKNGRATYRVPINARLRTAINGEVPSSKAAPAEAPRTESALSPREMQARLRAGASVEAVAKAAGVPVERVETYFGPVLSERIQVLDAAQSSTMNRPRWGDSARPLGDAVTANLAKTAGIREETVTWSTRRRKDAVWIVRVDFIARGRRRSAEWEWDPRERELTAIDHTATSLGYVEPRGGAPGRRTSSSRTTAARKKTTKKATAKKPTRKKTTAKKATRRKTQSRR
ncbi:MAG: hypothetical protein QOG53_3446 [Frankiales bacterium]|nr:hypothetical protein [Frankiales bacterium]